MTKYNKKIFASILAAVIAVGMFGCSQQNAQESSGQTTQETSDESGAEENTSTTDVSFSRSNEEIAKDFCTVWADKWAQIEEEGVTSNQQGRAFLEDMDNDGAKELIFLYDNDVNFNAVVYRISSDKTEELGTFVLSNTSPELNFTVYQGENGVILKHVAVRELTSETQNETEESYIMMEDRAKFCRKSCSPLPTTEWTPTMTALWPVQTKSLWKNSMQCVRTFWEMLRKLEMLPLHRKISLIFLIQML